MNRNGLVFVPREPPKRVILYPLQDSLIHHQQQQQQLNGHYSRAKTDLLINHHHETLSQSNNNNRPSRQQPLSSALNGTLKSNEKSNHDATVSNTSGHAAALSAGQKTQNPYYANPFFRPRIITNQQPATTTNLVSTSPSSSTTTDISAQSILPSSSTVTTTLGNKGKQPFYPRIQSPLLFSNGKQPDPTVITSASQDDSRPWIQSVVSTHIVRCNGNNERSNGPLKASEINVTTDIVISLMDTSGSAHNLGSISTLNHLVRTDGTKDESSTTRHLLSSSEQLPNTPPVSLVDISSTANNNNQNWKKALVANFQKNQRNIPSAKLSYTRQPTTSLQTTTPSINELINQQQQQQQQPSHKSDRFTSLNAIVIEHSTSTNDNPSVIPNSAGISSESLLIPNQENNLMERSASLQIHKPTHLNATAIVQKNEETSNSNNVPCMAITIPSALLMTKPPVNVEQQRANITRVMIRRDFVKPLEIKPPMPAASNIRSLMTSQPMKSDNVPTNNVIRVATIADNPNRFYQTQQLPPTVPLSQKSLLLFTTSNSTTKDSNKVDKSQPTSNGTKTTTTPTTTNGGNSSSMNKMRQSHTGTTNGDMNNNESRRRREEIINRPKTRAASASTTSNYE
ncbi:hypothetical protein I4U23_007953 [Adineta vaga]|nr:hypothetical protein I4U23_007953 [Adineta vaga]